MQALVLAAVLAATARLEQHAAAFVGSGGGVRLPSASHAGDLIVVALLSDTAGCGVTDNASNTYLTAAPAQQGIGPMAGNYTRILYAVNMLALLLLAAKQRRVVAGVRPTRRRLSSGEG